MPHPLLALQLDRAAQGAHRVLAATARPERETVHQHRSGVAGGYFQDLRGLFDRQRRVAFEQPRRVIQRDLDGADWLCPCAHLEVSTLSLCPDPAAIRNRNWSVVKFKTRRSATGQTSGSRIVALERRRHLVAVREGRSWRTSALAQGSTNEGLANLGRDLGFARERATAEPCKNSVLLTTSVRRVGLRFKDTLVQRKG
jgi:hypothetical protein